MENNLLVGLFEKITNKMADIKDSREHYVKINKEEFIALTNAVVIPNLVMEDLKEFSFLKIPKHNVMFSLGITVNTHKPSEYHIQMEISGPDKRVFCVQILIEPFSDTASVSHLSGHEVEVDKDSGIDFINHVEYNLLEEGKVVRFEELERDSMIQHLYVEDSFEEITEHRFVVTVLNI